MEDGRESRGQLQSELARLRRRVSELEESMAEGNHIEGAPGLRLPFFKTLIDAIPGAIFFTDTEGRYLYCNKTFEALFGHSPADIMGKTAYDLAFRDIAETYSGAALGLGEPGFVRYRVATQDATGASREAIFQKSFFFDGAGQVAGIVGIATDITEHIQTEKALREAEDKFKDVAEKCLAGIYMIQNGVFKYVNPRLAEIHGYTVEELMDKGPKDVVVPEDLPIVAENLQKRLSGQTESVHFEFRIHTKDEEIRNVEVYGSLTVYEGMPAVIGTLLDITERKKSEEALRRYREHLEELVEERTTALEKEVAEHKRTEKALRESEEKYRAIFENATEGIFQSTPEGRFLSVNPAFAKMFGYASPEEIMIAITDVGHQLYADFADREHLRQLFEKVGAVEGYETEAFRKDGEKIWVSINAHAVKDEMGVIVRYEGTNQDITERKKIERRLKESEERYRAAIEHSNDGVAIARGGLHLYVNQKFLEMFGYDSPADIIGDNTRKDVHPDDRERVLEYSRRRLRGEPAPSRYEFKGIKKDGTVIFVEASVAVIDYYGESASLAYLRDVTERKQMEEKLETMSIVDELTGLYNRRGFFAFCEEQLKLAERTGKGMELLFIDLDKMKWINDTLGHKEGDAALMEVAEILRETFRKSDIIGRMGGDEFAILVVEAAGASTEPLKTRLQETADRHRGLREKQYDISLSVGVACFSPERPTSLDELIIRADQLMYEDKRQKQYRRVT